MDIGKEVEGAIREGQRVQEAVRDITLKALSQRELDFAAMRKVTREALDAVREAASRQEANVGEVAKQAVDGVDKALAQAAQALKLTLEEAGGRAEKFSREDLAKARESLSTLEKMFVETLGETARAASGAGRAVFADLARHAETSGTAIGQQLRDSAALSEQVAQAFRAQVRAGLDAAATSGAIFSRAAAGVLAGLADAIDPKKPR